MSWYNPTTWNNPVDWAGDAVADAVDWAGENIKPAGHSAKEAAEEASAGMEAAVAQAAAAQAAANALPDDFDLLIREAMFSALDRKPVSDRQATFTAGPRGLEGPAGAASDLTVPGSLSPQDKENMDLYDLAQASRPVRRGGPNPGRWR
jgi:hypothetical protein